MTQCRRGTPFGGRSQPRRDHNVRKLKQIGLLIVALALIGGAMYSFVYGRKMMKVQGIGPVEGTGTTTTAAPKASPASEPEAPPTDTGGGRRIAPQPPQ
jgi:hypothetical protein